MLIEQESSEQLNPEAAAFDATVDNFKISLSEIARVSGVELRKIKDFRNGKQTLTSRTMSRILLALSPTELAFYSAMVGLQTAAISGGVTVERLKFREIVDITDIYRQAYQIVVKTFSIVQLQLSKKIDIRDENISAWKNGRRDFQQESLSKIKNGFTLEQRMFYQSLVEVLFIVGADKMRSVRPS
jgi:predicted transcriptional regulator